MFCYPPLYCNVAASPAEIVAQLRLRIYDLTTLLHFIDDYLGNLKIVSKIRDVSCGCKSAIVQPFCRCLHGSCTLLCLDHATTRQLIRAPHVSVVRVVANIKILNGHELPTVHEHGAAISRSVVMMLTIAIAN
jgi:hypothetical protein